MPKNYLILGKNTEKYHEDAVQVLTTENRDLKKKVGEITKLIAKLKQQKEKERRDMLDRMNKTEAFDQTMYNRVKELSKSLVFRTHKFFTTQEDIDDYTTPLSPGAMIMNKLSVPQERRAAFWNQYKLGMKEGFDAQRQNVQTAIGNKWKGEEAVAACDSLGWNA
jgi:hypothetical protein